MSEDEEPDWLAELAKGGDAMRRQIEPLVQTVAEFARIARPDWPKTATMPMPLRLAWAADSRIRELKLVMPVAIQVRRPIQLSIAQPAQIVGSGSVTLPRMGVTGQLEVGDRPSRSAVRIDGQIVVLVLVWLFVFVLPLMGPDLPPKLHTMLSDSYGTFALALAITWRIRDKQR
jgi:hypothetical protein